MAVAHDGEADLSGRVTGVNPWTIAGKTTAGIDRAGIFRFMHLTTNTINAGYPTWAGVEMTAVGSVERGTQTIRAYRIVNPPTNASDIVVNFAGAHSGPYLVTSYNGVHQTDPAPAASVNTAQGSGTTPTVDVSSATGQMVLDAMDVANVISSVGAGQTAEYIDTTGGSDRFGGSREAGAATVTMSWTVSSGAWSTLAFALAEPAAAGPVGRGIQVNQAVNRASTF